MGFFRKELALQQKLAEETRRHASMVAANQTIHMHGNDGCVSHEGVLDISITHLQNNHESHGVIVDFSLSFMNYYNSSRLYMIESPRVLYCLSSTM